MNLKAILMELGNKLVTERHFHPRMCMCDICLDAVADGKVN